MKYWMSFNPKSLILVYFWSHELKIFFNNGEVLNGFNPKLIDAGAFQISWIENVSNHGELLNEFLHKTLESGGFHAPSIFLGQPPKFIF